MKYLICFMIIIFSFLLHDVIHSADIADAGHTEECNKKGGIIVRMHPSYYICIDKNIKIIEVQK